MQMRALNVNTAPRRVNGQRKPSSSTKDRAAPTNVPSATFISPPRNPTVSANHMSATSAAAPLLSTEPGPTTAPTSVMTDVPVVEDFTPAQMLAMAEASYAKCPCETCDAYRAFYAQQVADAEAASAAGPAVQTPPPASVGRTPMHIAEGDELSAPAVLDDDMPSPNAPAGSYYFVPRPMSRQPPATQPQPSPTPAPVPAVDLMGSHHRGSLRQQFGSVPMLAMTRAAATNQNAFAVAPSIPMALMCAPMPAEAFTGRVHAHQPSLSPDPAHTQSLNGPNAYGADRRPRHSSGSYAFESVNAPAPSRALQRVGSGAAPASSAAAASAARHAEAVERFHQVAPGHVVELACTPEGKALLQAALRAREASVMDIVVPELCTDMDTVALDANACHVLRLTVELCTPEQLIDIVGSFHETLVLNMCTVSQYTRRTLQALMDRQQTAAAAASLDDTTSYPLDFTPIVEVLAQNAVYLSVTQQGCISLMRVFERCEPSQKVFLMAPLIPSLAVLAFDPFGNYVTQCAVEHSEVSVAAHYVLKCFENQLLRMSCDKFASNVVEKIIRCCSSEPAVRAMLLDELLFNPAALQELVMDSFGNFVVQSLIESSTDASEMKRICDRLKPVLPSSPYAVRIEGKLKNKRCYVTPAAATHAPSMGCQPHQPPSHALASYAPNPIRGLHMNQRQVQWQALQ